MKGLSPVVGVVLLIAISVIAAVGVWYWVGGYTEDAGSVLGVDYDGAYVVVESFNGTSAFLRNLGGSSANKAAFVYNTSGALIGWFGLNESNLASNTAAFYALHLQVADVPAGKYFLLGEGYPKVTFILKEEYVKPTYVVFFAKNYGEVFAYYENGTKYWNSTLDSSSSISSSPAIYGDKLFIGNDAGKLFSLNATNGTILWSFEPYNAGIYPLTSSPFVAGNVVYFSMGGYIYALNASSGYQLWNHSIYQSQLSDSTDYSSSPVLVGNYLYVGEGTYNQTKNGSFYKLDVTDNGSEVCSYAQEGGNDFSSVLVKNGVAYVGVGGPYNYTYAFYTDNCTVKWKKSLEGYALSSPLIFGDYLFISEDGGGMNKTLALNISADDSNRVIWSSSSLTDSISSSVFVYEGKVFVGSDDDSLHVLNFTTGEELWNFQTGGDINPSPVVVDGVVYFGSYDGLFYAVNISTRSQVWNVTTTKTFFSSPVVCNIRNWNCVYPTISGMSN